MGHSSPRGGLIFESLPRPRPTQSSSNCCQSKVHCWPLQIPMAAQPWTNVNFTCLPTVFFFKSYLFLSGWLERWSWAAQYDPEIPILQPSLACTTVLGSRSVGGEPSAQERWPSLVVCYTGLEPSMPQTGPREDVCRQHNNKDKRGRNPPTTSDNTDWYLFFLKH